MKAELIDYQSFVLLKEAPPYTISEDDFRLLHGALGLSTEVLELLQANSKENVEEELGDILWYITLCFHLCKVDLHELETPSLSPSKDPIQLLIGRSEEFVSQVKKHVIYNKRRHLDICLVATWEAFCWVTEATHIPLLPLIRSNKEKLSKRYESEFTADESEHRRDKSETSTGTN